MGIRKLLYLPVYVVFGLTVYERAVKGGSRDASAASNDNNSHLICLQVVLSSALQHSSQYNLRTHRPIESH